MLHITEHIGRGVPRIIRTYGRDTIKIKENTIQVTILFDRLGAEVYADNNLGTNTQVSTQDAADRIIEFCSIPRTFIEIAGYLGYTQRKSVRRYLNPLIDSGRIAMTIPEKPSFLDNLTTVALDVYVFFANSLIFMSGSWSIWFVI